MKIISWIADKIAIISTILIGLFCLILIIPYFFGYRAYTTLSGSMEPTIHTASLAYVDTKDQEPEIGDIVAFRVRATGEDTFVLHRVVGEKDGAWITKGDANENADMITLKPENMIGTFRYSIPYGGYLFANRGIVLISVFLWIMGWNLISLLADRVSGL